MVALPRTELWARVSRLGWTLIGCSVLLLGCEGAHGPELVSVHRLSPGRAAVSDRVLVTGDGFPDGRSATVTFRGDLFRPGVPPEHDVTLSARAAPTTQNTIAFTLEPALERRFVGRGGGAVHTTFHGDVKVLFDASARGTIPIFGTLHEVTFDVLPTVAEDVAETAPGSDLAAVLGLTGTPEPGGAGLRLGSVVPDGRAGNAGLRAGDIVLAEDGVTVLDLPDLAPESGKHTASLTVLRDGRVLSDLAVDVDGVSPLGASALGWPVVMLGLLATMFAFVRGFFGRALALVAAAREANSLTGRRAARGVLREAVSALVDPIAGGPELAAAASLVCALVLVGLVRLSMKHVILSADLDLIATSLAAAFTLLLARFSHGGATRRGFSLGRAFSALFETCVGVMPALLAIAGAVLASGRFVLAEMVGDQGAAPLRWAFTRNPGLLVLGLLLLGTTIPRAGDGPSGLPGAPGGLLRSLVRLSEWAYLWVISALFVVVFLGGYRLPGVTSAVQEASARWSMLGALLAVAKVCVTVVTTSAVRSALGRPETTDASELARSRVLPIAALGTVTAAAWSAAADTAPAAGLPDLAARISVLVILAMAAYGAAVFLRTSRSTQSPLNPWL